MQFKFPNIPRPNLTKFFSNFKERVKPLLTIKNIVIAVVVGLFLIQYFQIQSIFGTFSFLQGRDSSLITEIGQIREGYMEFGTDLNEIRTFLRLPTKNYMALDETNAADDENTNQIQLALFEYIDYLAVQKNLEENLTKHTAFLQGLASDEEFLAFIANEDLTLSPVTETEYSLTLSINTVDGEELLFFYLSKDNGTLLSKTITTKESVSAEVSEEFQNQIMELILDDKTELLEHIALFNELQAQIEATINSEETLAALAELEITLDTDFTESGLEIAYSIYNKNNELIGEIVLSTAELTITLIGKNDPSLSVQATDISSALVPFLEDLETETFLEQRAGASEIDLKEAIFDGGLQLLLSEADMYISTEPREDNLRIYYDLYDEQAGFIGSFVLEKATGVVNIVDSSGNNAQNLLFFDPNLKKKTITLPSNVPNYGTALSHAENTLNILVAGKQGMMLDTMIFVHIDEGERSIKMVSIPRDLFYNGRKINSYAYFYGMPEITGYALDKYILIDMYAFIDVVNLVGGIDVHLDRPLIDPFYKVVNNGVSGTLHYEPGDYHLNGVEALRLARSRQTTSDFARAERQQMILEALQSKARNFGFGDADVIYEIVKTVLSKTETNIKLDEAIAYFFRYQNFEIASTAVLSTGNVLYVPPYITEEDCQALVDEALVTGVELPACEDENHAYTLLPRDDDWNLIRWFFREQLEG